MKEIIKERVKDLWKANFEHYSEDYPILDGEYTSDAIELAQDVALSYFENRTDSEIEEDDALNLTQIDYVNFVMEAMSEVL